MTCAAKLNNFCGFLCASASVTLSLIISTVSVLCTSLTGSSYCTASTTANNTFSSFCSWGKYQLYRGHSIQCSTHTTSFVALVVFVDNFPLSSSSVPDAVAQEFVHIKECRNSEGRDLRLHALPSYFDTSYTPRRPFTTMPQTQPVPLPLHGTIGSNALPQSGEGLPVPTTLHASSAPISSHSPSFGASSSGSAMIGSLAPLPAPLPLHSVAPSSASSSALPPPLNIASGMGNQSSYAASGASVAPSMFSASVYDHSVAGDSPITTDEHVANESHSSIEREKFIPPAVSMSAEASMPPPTLVTTPFASTPLASMSTAASLRRGSLHPHLALDIPLGNDVDDFHLTRERQRRDSMLMPLQGSADFMGASTPLPSGSFVEDESEACVDSKPLLVELNPAKMDVDHDSMPVSSHRAFKTPPVARSGSEPSSHKEDEPPTRGYLRHDRRLSIAKHLPPASFSSQCEVSDSIARARTSQALQNPTVPPTRVRTPSPVSMSKQHSRTHNSRPIVDILQHSRSCSPLAAVVHHSAPSPMVNQPTRTPTAPVAPRAPSVVSASGSSVSASRSRSPSSTPVLPHAQVRNVECYSSRFVCQLLHTIGTFPCV